MKTVKLVTLTPVPRGANYMEWETFRMGPKYIYAHQLLYIFDGSGTGMLDGEEFALEPGLLTIYGPGTLHDFRSDAGVKFTGGTMCFSWVVPSEKQLSVGNRSVDATDQAYWEYADEPVQIESLPPFPIRLHLTGALRRHWEQVLRETGLLWRKEPHTLEAIVKVKSTLLELVALLRKCLAAPAESPEPASLERFRKFVGEHYAADISRRDAARAAGVCESHLTGLLIRYCRSNFNDYLNETRLAAGLELLQYSNLNVKEVAAAVGFHSSSYFIARFKERYGIAPGKARNGV